MPLTNQGSYDLFSHLGSYRNIMQFQISYRRENGKKILYQMQKTTAPGRWTEEETDLPFLRTVLATHQKSWEPSFWKVMDSFVLLAYASFAASRTFLQQLLASLNLRIRFILSLQTKKSDFYELWQQHKQLKIMVMSEAWPDISYEGYIHQFQPEHRIH